MNAMCGAGGYTGDVATYFDGSGSGYNSSAYLRVECGWLTEGAAALRREQHPHHRHDRCRNAADVPDEPYQR